MKRKVVAFDFDGTLTQRDTLVEFIRFSCGNLRLVWGLLLHLPWLVAYRCGLYPNWKAKQMIFKYFFAGKRLRDFDNLCEDFFKARGKALLRHEAVCRVREYRDDGCEMVIVSASLENWVVPFARFLGIPHVIGTKAGHSVDGRLDGRFATPNCYGAEKVRRLQTLFPERETYILVAYGDSRGDREMLACADEAYYKPFRK